MKSDFHREGDWVVARLRGDIDMGNAPDLELIILDAITNADIGLTVDLSGVDYIDSAGLKLVVDLRSYLQARQQKLFLLVPESSMLYKALELGGVAAIVPVHRSVESDREARAVQIP